MITIATVMMNAYRAAFDAIGLDVSDTLRTEGVTRSMLRDPYSSMSTDIFEHLWIDVINLRPDATLASAAGLALPPHELDLLDHISASSDTVGRMLHLANRYHKLASNTISVTTTRGTHDWVWFVDTVPDPYCTLTEQWGLACTYTRLKRVPGFSIEEVHLSHPDAGNADRFARLWNVPVKLGRRYTGMRLSHGVLNLPNPKANPYLQATLTRIADGMEVRRLDRTPFATRVRASLSRTLPSGRCTVAEIADNFGMSVRSFQRRLLEEGVRFSQLLDTHRRRSVCRRLLDGELTIDAIAHDHGYDNQSSLNRAFRRWTGTTPTEWARLAAERVDIP